jgi:hypothetical protein
MTRSENMPDYFMSELADTEVTQSRMSPELAESDHKRKSKWRLLCYELIKSLNSKDDKHDKNMRFSHWK